MTKRPVDLETATARSSGVNLFFYLSKDTFLYSFVVGGEPVRQLFAIFFSIAILATSVRLGSTLLAY